MAKFRIVFSLLSATLLSVLTFHLAVGKSLDHHESKRATFVDDNPKFSFDDVFNSDFNYKSFNPRWVSGNEFIYSTPSRDVYRYNIDTKDNTTLMDGSIYTDNDASGYYVSADQLYITLRTNYSKGWRHSYNASYLIYDVTNGDLVTTNPLPPDIQYITWAPQGNALAYVHGFDIYYRPSVTGTEVRITDTGRGNFVYNGIPDWVYEEEMISSNNVMYFSPDGAMLAYAQFNDTPCDHIKYIRYEGKQYPTVIDVSYPKAGTNQPTNKVFVYNFANGIEEEVQPATSLTDNGDYLFNRVVWANNNSMAVLWCDRAQTWSSMKMFDYDPTLQSWNTVSTEFEHKVTGGWLHQRRPYWIPVFGNSVDEYFTVRPNGDWQQVALVNRIGNVTFVTEGNFTVTSQSASYPSLYHYDQTNDYIYFLATLEGPGKRQVYRRKGHDTASLQQCVSCTFASNHTKRCDYVLASFSTDGSRVVISCRGEGVPLYALCSVNGAATSDENILEECEVVENNDDLLEKVASTSMSNVTHGKIPSDTGYDFHYEMWTPPGFDESRTYPLLIDVYAGPGYQNVDYLWTRSWAPRYVPVNLNAIVVRVDGRGSNFYGDTFMHEVYRGLGQKEIEDQIEAAGYFGNMSYVDESKIAVWGWSYGGFATSHAIGSSGGDIKCGIAVAPLTDWELYDTIYAERYMGTPAQNPEGYSKANVMMKASNFSDSSFYLIHGMADDNVHFQNAAKLEKALVNADVSFKNFFYADQDHSINVGNARRHVYKIITQQLCQCFDIEVPSDIWG